LGVSTDGELSEDVDEQTPTAALPRRASLSAAIRELIRLDIARRAKDGFVTFKVGGVETTAGTEGMVRRYNVATGELEGAMFENGRFMLPIPMDTLEAASKRAAELGVSMDDFVHDVMLRGLKALRGAEPKRRLKKRGKETK
jgi:hypothetical protein